MGLLIPSRYFYHEGHEEHEGTPFKRVLGVKDSQGLLFLNVNWPVIILGL